MQLFDELRLQWGYVTFLGALAAIAVGLYVVLVAGIDPARKGLPPGVHENFGRKSSVQLETRALPWDGQQTSWRRRPSSDADTTAARATTFVAAIEVG